MGLHLKLSLLTLVLGVTTVHSETTPPPLILQGHVESGFLQDGQLSSEELRESLRGRQFERFNPTHVNGEELVDGDMLLTKEQKKYWTDRKAIPYLTSRWPNGPAGKPLVPYMFNDTSVNQTAILAAINHWQQNTCIQFTPVTNLSAPHLKFYYGSGCNSNVGMLSQAGQYISLGTGCYGLGTIAHEIGHSLGFFHEQSRSDRDNYVIINTANVIPSYINNFQIAVDNNYSVPYDYSSDMHYGSYYFTANGYTTIATKNFFAQQLIGQRSGLSHMDKLLANRMYPCISSWLASCGLASDPCLNNGYTGASCTCVCPSGTTGARCETRVGGYYDSLFSTCSVNVTTAGNITSPNYPGNYPPNYSCVKVIKAPSPCYTIQLRFNTFQLYGQNPYCNNNLCCYFDSLEIRTTDPYNGTVYCSNMISPNQIFTSNTGQMILIFNTVSNYYQGWSAEVSFIYNSSCLNTTTTTTSTSTSTTSTPTTTRTSTTTSTPTTTRTSTSTSTPTTTRTSTTTSTPTTTRTSTSTTSTSTTTVTTTRPGLVGCGLGLLPSGAIQWTSPRFPVQNYPNSIRCNLNISCTVPQWMQVQLNPFRLENMTGSVCNDYVTFSQFYNLGNLTFCGTQNMTFNVSSCNLLGMFLTNSAINDTGFNITFTPKTSSCHQKIYTGGVGSTGTISTPTPSQTWTSTGCEWWLESPLGTVINMQFLSTSLSGNCTATSVLLDGTGGVAYPPATSKQYCGTAVPPTFASTTNKLNMMYYATLNNSPLAAKWTVTSATG